MIWQLLSEKKTHVAFKKGKALMAFEAERFREAKMYPARSEWAPKVEASSLAARSATASRSKPP